MSDERTPRTDAMQALTSLTPGGSEYANDPAACVAYVRKVRESQHEAIVKFKKEADTERAARVAAEHALDHALAHGNRWRERFEDEERARLAAEAKVDSLMLEYCPDEMTPEQVERWAAHQQPVSPETEAAIDAAQVQK